MRKENGKTIKRNFTKTFLSLLIALTLVMSSFYVSASAAQDETGTSADPVSVSDAEEDGVPEAEAAGEVVSASKEEQETVIVDPEDTEGSADDENTDTAVKEDTAEEQGAAETPNDEGGPDEEGEKDTGSNDLADAAIYAAEQTYIYSGEAIEPSVSVYLGGKQLEAGTDYTVEYKNNIKAGTAAVVVTGTGSYMGTGEVHFTIAPKSIEDEDITPAVSKKKQYYTGSEVKPKVAVYKEDGSALKKGTDYTVSYADNINAGTASVTFRGTGNYTGTVCKTFSIKRKSLKAEDITISLKSSATYTGTYITPNVTVKYGSVKLVNGTDYTVKYGRNIKAGTAAVKIVGTGNYYGTVYKHFTIKRKYITSDAAIKMKSTVYYTGSSLWPEVKVIFDGKKLKLGRDYIVKYYNNKNPGTARVVIKGIGNYRGTVEKNFQIKPEKVALSLQASYRSINVSWDPAAAADGYIIEYCLNADFTGDVQVRVAEGGSTGFKKLVGTYPGYTYYVRICSYVSIDSNTIRSDWSKVRKVNVVYTDTIDYVNWAVAIANDNNVGYGHYWGNNPNYPVSISCAGLVGMALTYCGYADFRTYGQASYGWYYWDNTQDDALYRQKLMEAGFVQIAYDPNNLQRGDILYCAEHTGIYLGNGLSVEARGNGAVWYDQYGKVTGPTYADDDGYEIAIYNTFAYQGWQYVFRPM